MFCLIFLLGRIILVTELMARSSILKQISFSPRFSSHVRTLQFHVHRHILCIM